MNIHKNSPIPARVTRPVNNPRQHDTLSQERREQEVPLALPAFTIEKASNEGEECCLDLHDSKLADWAFEHLDIQNMVGISRPDKGTSFNGTREELQSILNFAALLTSVTSTLPAAAGDSDAANNLRAICGYLVTSGSLRMLDGGVVTFDSKVVATLAHELSLLTRKGPEAAFALFSCCSASSQLAILEDEKSKEFVEALATDPKATEPFKALLQAAAAQALLLNDTQTLKQTLDVCPLFARDSVLKALAEINMNKLAQLCTNDGELATKLQAFLPPADHGNPACDMAWLRKQLDMLTSSAPPVKGKVASSLAQIADAIASVPSPYPRGPGRSFAVMHIDAAVKTGVTTGNWKPLEDSCRIFSHKEGLPNENGQLFLAEVLGQLAAEAWFEDSNANGAKVCQIVAAFLNLAPVEAAMKHFADSSQGILTTHNGRRVWETCEGLLTDAGLEARTSWGRSTLELALRYPENPRWAKTVDRVVNLLNPSI